MHYIFIYIFLYIYFIYLFITNYLYYTYFNNSLYPVEKKKYFLFIFKNLN